MLRFSLQSLRQPVLLLGIMALRLAAFSFACVAGVASAAEVCVLLLGIAHRVCIVQSLPQSSRIGAYVEELARRSGWKWSRCQ